MGTLDFIRGELIEIIEFNEDSRDTLSYRWPDQDHEIKNGGQLIVRESQTAQFMYLGQYGDAFAPGKHTLTTENIPVLSTLKGWKYGFETPFKADVFYVTTRLFTGYKRGTANSARKRVAFYCVYHASTGRAAQVVRLALVCTQFAEKIGHDRHP